MAFAGLKKQINKANQYVTEKMGGAEGTKLDMDFMDMERKTDVTVELVEELQTKTKEFLQPNPTARAKMIAVKGISKLSGQAKSNTYPQPEGILADCMLTYGKKLGDDSPFALALIEFGDSLKQMADVKYSLDDNIKQNFLEPLHHLQTKDLKEVMHHRKKLQGRRLDFDCKRRRQAKGSHITDDEIRSAEEKFAESLHLAQMGMYNLLENDVEQISQLVTFAEALYEYHSQCADVLKILVEVLAQKREEAESRPKAEFVPKTLTDLNIEASVSGSEGGGANRLSGIINAGNGNGFGEHWMQSNGRHYSPSHTKQNSMNSHHQLYSSQQNLSMSAFNNNNNTYNKNMENVNFSRSRVYGSYQSLSSSKFSLPINDYTSSANTKNSQTIDQGSNYDWLNAWNNPPPKVPSVLNYTSTNTNNMKSSTCATSTISKNSYSFNNLSRTSKGLFNDARTASPLPSPMRSPAKTPGQSRSPCCTALYDFEPENPNELGFKENDTIQLLNKVDENWYEGSLNGRTGYFPQSYVQVIVPLPNN